MVEVLLLGGWPNTSKFVMLLAFCISNRKIFHEDELLAVYIIRTEDILIPTDLSYRHLRQIVLQEACLYLSEGSSNTIYPSISSTNNNNIKSSGIKGWQFIVSCRNNSNTDKPSSNKKISIS